MSYLDYNVAPAPTGFRKALFLNWPLVLLISAVACIGFLMLYSVAGAMPKPGPSRRCIVSPSE